MTSSSDESLADVVRGQAALIADLQARLDRLESQEEPVNAYPVRTGSHSAQTSNDMVVDPPSRRGFLRLAGAAAAGAAVAAVGNASPAAALDGGTFTGAETVFVNNGTDSTKAGVKGNFTGSTSNGIGGIGVLGQSDLLSSAAGVIGTASSGYGVYGTSATGYALYAASNGRLGFDPHLAGTTAPTTGGYKLGDIVMNANGDTFSCVIAGSGGSAKFRKLAGPAVAGQLHILSTQSRQANTFNTTVVPLNGGRSVPFVAPVPTGVTAVLGTITVYSPSAFTTPFGAGGYAAVVPTGTAVAGVAVTFSAGQMFMSGLFVSALNAGGVDVYVQGSAAHFTVDVIGYYA